MSKPRPGLSDPVTAVIAWRRFWKLMRWMILAAVVAVIAALFYLWQGGALLSVHIVIATAAGVSFTVLLGTGLMLLAFLSAGSGHDENVKHAADEMKDDPE